VDLEIFDLKLFKEVIVVVLSDQYKAFARITVLLYLNNITKTSLLLAEA
jgi:hypothetical protein